MTSDRETVRNRDYLYEEIDKILGAYFRQLFKWLDYSNAVIITSSPEEISRQEWLNRKTKMLVELDKLVNDVSQEFDDLGTRLELFILLKSMLSELISLTRKFGDKYFKQIAIILHDSVKNVYAEDMDKSCLKDVVQILRVMKKEKLDQADTFECNRISFA